MIYITDETRQLIDNAYAEGAPCILGTASGDGYPQISMKGSVLVFDRETLAYWERAKRSALENVGENPNVVVFYRNPEKRINWRFYGTATVYESGAIWDNVMRRTIQAELDRDPDLEGVAVLVRVNQVIELSGNVLQQRD
jgi:hypothetical protein